MAKLMTKETIAFRIFNRNEINANPKGHVFVIDHDKNCHQNHSFSDEYAVQCVIKRWDAQFTGMSSCGISVTSALFDMHWETHIIRRCTQYRHIYICVYTYVCVWNKLQNMNVPPLRQTDTEYMTKIKKWHSRSEDDDKMSYKYILSIAGHLNLNWSIGQIQPQVLQRR